MGIHANLILLITYYSSLIVILSRRRYTQILFPIPSDSLPPDPQTINSVPHEYDKHYITHHL